MDPKLRQQLFVKKHKGQIITVLVLSVVLLPMLSLNLLPATFKQHAAGTTISSSAGDMDQNNIINEQDYKLFTACYSHPDQANICTPDQRMRADINHDGLINGTDYNLFVNSKIK